MMQARFAHPSVDRVEADVVCAPFIVGLKHSSTRAYSCCRHAFPKRSLLNIAHLQILSSGYHSTPPGALRKRSLD